MPANDSLGKFLRNRREHLLPQDAGLPPGGRRRTPGLRREEVSALAATSPDYYGRAGGAADERRGHHADVVLSPASGHRLVIFRPRPGSGADAQLSFLSVLGGQNFG